MPKKIFILLLFLTNLSKEGVSQEYLFKHFGQKNGLLNSNVLSISQDKDGFYWIATDEGISKFDGTNFTNFNLKSGLIGNTFTYVFCDKNNIVWIGTDEGISSIEKGMIKNFPFPRDKKANTYSITSDNDGVIWFATYGNGIGYLKENKLNFINELMGIKIDSTFCIAIDNNNCQWISTNKGVVKYDSKSVEIYNKKTGLASNLNFTLTIDNAGNVWVGGYIDGISLIKKTGKSYSVKQFPINENLKTELIGKIEEDKNCNIWFATSNKGLIKYDRKNFIFINELNGLPTSSLNTVFCDANNKILTGNYNFGISYLANENFKSYNIRTGLPNNKVVAVYKFNSKIFLCIYQKGLFTFDDGNLKQFLFENDEFNRTTITNLLIDGDNFFIAFENRGVIQFREKSKKLVKVKNEVLEHLRKKLGTVSGLQKSNGNLIVSSYGSGLFIINLKINAYKTYDISNGLISNSITSFYCSNIENNIYLFNDVSPQILDASNSSFSNVYSLSSALANKFVWANSKISNSRIAFSTNNSGVIIFDEEAQSTSKISQFENLKSNDVRALQFDKNLLFVCTDFGMDIIELADKKRVLNLTERLLIEPFEVNLNAVALLDGKLFLGTNSGLKEFDYKKILEEKSILPKFYLNNFKINNKLVDKQTGNLETLLPIHLNYNQSDIDFTINAATLENFDIQYMLEGWDNKWKNGDRATLFNYQHLKPGSYRFLVRCKNIFQKEYMNSCNFEISIAKPWWETIYFYLFILTSISISTYFYVDIRTKKLTKEKSILENIVEERTKEIKSQRDEIAKSKALIEHQQMETKQSIEYAQHIQESILPDIEHIYECLPNSFVLYKPKDIVSGDFFAFQKIIKTRENMGDEFIIGAADCTGHGVPGSLMSMLGSNILYQIINEKQITKPNEILYYLNLNVTESLKQNKNAGNDGMDIAICKFSELTKEGNISKMSYAGAYRPLYLIRNGQLIETKATKTAIGGQQKNEERIYENHEFELLKNDTIYIASDGYADQFGGIKGKKLTTVKFKEILLSIQEMNMKEQEKFLSDFIENWRGMNEQVDDICVIGIRI